MCADGWDYLYDGYSGEIKECPKCGEDTDDEGVALKGCKYSPILCVECGSAPCDGSC